MALAKGFDIPAGMQISPFGDASGWGEDDTICRTRMQREGWQVKQEATVSYGGVSPSEWLDEAKGWMDKVHKILAGDGAIELPSPRQATSPYADAGPMFAVYDPPEIMQKRRGTNVLEMTTLGYGEKNGATFVIKFRVLDPDNQLLLDLGRADWVDWSDEGDLLFAKDGGIYRLKKSDWNIENAMLLVNLADARFEAVRPPSDYRRWKS